MTTEAAMGFHSEVGAERVRPVLSRPRYRMRLLRYVQLLACDLMCLSLCFGLAAFLTEPSSHESFVLSLLVIPLFPGVAFGARAYSVDALQRPAAGVAKALYALFYTSLIIFLALYLLKQGATISRLSFLGGAASSAVLITLSRLLLGRVFKRAADGSFVDEIVIADSVAADVPRRAVCLNAADYMLSPRLDDPHMLDRLARLVRGADNVVIACPPERRTAWAMVLKGLNARGNIMVPELQDWGAVGVDHYYHHRTLTVANGPINMPDRVKKRVLDLAVSIPAIALLLPLMGMIAIAIRLDSRGPVFFRQPRLGRDNALFSMLKFRSMYTDRLDSAGHTSTARGDPRVTRVGRVLRATSMDELPQLLNVALGSMSIVGPRPHALGSTAGEQLFWHIDNRYWHRHAIKPGITGLAQIRGFRGNTTEIKDLVNRLQADLDYTKGWSISRDIGIILSTFRVLVHRNAY
jgi:polysaccharide biosynthesis protein PslA